MLAQVAGGRSFSMSKLRDFIHVVQREKAAIGVYVTLRRNVSAGGRAEAARLGRTRKLSEGNQRQHIALRDQNTANPPKLSCALTRARELAEALEQRRAMEAQLREGYKVAAMGTLGGGWARELEGVLEPIERLAREGLEESGGDGQGEKDRLTRVAEAAGSGRSMIERMLAFGDGGMREMESVVAADGV